MKKLIAVAVSICLVMSLASCGGKEENAPVSQSDSQEDAQSDSQTNTQGDAQDDSRPDAASGSSSENQTASGAGSSEASTKESPAASGGPAVYKLTAGQASSAEKAFQPQGLWYLFTYLEMEFDSATGTVTLYSQGGSREAGTEAFAYDPGTGEMTWGEGADALTGTVMVNEFGVLCLTGPIAEQLFGLPAAPMAGEKPDFDGNGRWCFGHYNESQPQIALKLDAQEGMTVYEADSQGNWRAYLDHENLKFGWLEENSALVTFDENGVVTAEYPVAWVNGLAVTEMYNRFTVLAQAPADLLDRPAPLDWIP